MDYSPSSREYQVFFVDYGELQWVSETEVQAISESFLELPCQAVRACLAGLELSEWEGSGREGWGWVVVGRGRGERWVGHIEDVCAQSWWLCTAGVV